MADELQAVRARLGTYFDKGGSIKDQCVVNALCLTLAALRMGEEITEIGVVAAGEKFTVTNNGAGLPVEAAKGIPGAETMMTSLNACHKHPGHAGLEAHICKSGLAAVTAISASARVVTRNGARTLVQKYSVGRPTGEFQQVDAEMQGTRLDFELDKRWSGGGGFDLPAIEVRVRSLGVDLEGVTFTLKDS